MLEAPDFRWDNTDFSNQDEQDSMQELLVNELTKFMNKVGLNGSLHCEVKNFGWRHLDGYKDFNAHTGQELLCQILPDTHCTFDIWLDEAEKKITINNAHHDSPSGGELYIVTFKMEE